MKRFFAVITIVFILAVPSFALSNREYGDLMSNPEFARADRKLNKVYTDLRRTVSKAVWSVLKDEQKEWIDWGRDEDAQAYMDKYARKYSDEEYRWVKAYTMATNDRADYLPRRARELAREMSRRRPGRR